MVVEIRIAFQIDVAQPHTVIAAVGARRTERCPVLRRGHELRPGLLTRTTFGTSPTPSLPHRPRHSLPPRCGFPEATGRCIMLHQAPNGADDRGEAE